MEMVRPGSYFDFMKFRRLFIGTSLLLTVLSVIAIFYPGPNYGIDFAGGTELQLKFKGNVSSGELRTALERLGYSRPDVVSVEGSRNEYIIRVRDLSSLSEGQIRRMRETLRTGLASPGVQEMKVSPGGDKVTLRLSGSADPEAIRAVLERSGVKVRAVNAFGQSTNFRYEAQLVGVADQVVKRLADVFGTRGPEAPRRIEWVGPKAGEQLREAAAQSLLYSIAFIMLYVAFRFDLRFAPGGAIALIHDAFLTLGIFILLRKEVNLTTVAAVLTIVGYSINDTIVIYDRIRENMARMREKSLYELINISTSQMLSRTIITSGTVFMAISPFVVWGTPILQDLAIALMIGLVLGAYSTIYIAAPLTEWMDNRFFRKSSKA